MRILSLDGASASSAGFGLVERQGDTLHRRLDRLVDAQGAAVRLPGLVAAALDAAGWAAGWADAPLDLIAVLVGPGSFTGLRATLALAHGMALGGDCQVVGVSVGEALAESFPPPTRSSAEGPIWCVSQARRDRVFIETLGTDGVVQTPRAFMLESLPDPDGIPTLAGDARDTVGAVLSARGIAWQSGPARAQPDQIAAVALQRLAGLLAPRLAQPLYVDPPEARPATRPAA